MGKYQNSAATMEDLLAAIAAVEEDAGCQVRIVLEKGREVPHLFIRAEAYTDYGTRVGVARAYRKTSPSGRHLLDELQLALHGLYWDAVGKATGDPCAVEKGRVAKR